MNGRSLRVGPTQAPKYALSPHPVPVLNYPLYSSMANATSPFPPSFSLGLVFQTNPIPTICTPSHRSFYPYSYL